MNLNLFIWKAGKKLVHHSNNVRLLALLEKGLGLRSGVLPLQPQELHLWKIARDHKVATILTRNIQHQTELSAELKDEASGILQLCALREQAYLKEARRLRELLADKNIFIDFLKGLHLSDKVYPRQGLRVFRDMDFLIPKNEIEKAYDMLVAEGYRATKTKGPLSKAGKNLGDVLKAAERGEDAVSLEKDDYYLELHTTLLPQDMGQYSGDIPLSNEDRFIHLCIHATRHHFIYGLRHLVDILVLSLKFSINWKYVIEKTSSAKLEHLVFPAWKVSHECFPEHIQDAQGIEVSALTRLYTQKISRNLLEMPYLSMKLQGTPLLFHLASQHPIQTLMKLGLGTKEKAEYQTGKHEAHQRILWRLKRPWGLFYRHASPGKELLKFFFKN